MMRQSLFEMVMILWFRFLAKTMRKLFILASTDSLKEILVSMMMEPIVHPANQRWFMIIVIMEM